MSNYGSGPLINCLEGHLVHHCLCVYGGGGGGGEGRRRSVLVWRIDRWMVWCVTTLSTIPR